MSNSLIAVAVIAFILLIILAKAIRIVQEYERGVIFRLGRVLAHQVQPSTPGNHFLQAIGLDRRMADDLK